MLLQNNHGDYIVLKPAQMLTVVYILLESPRYFLFKLKTAN
jgi:hypothetical protein